MSFVRNVSLLQLLACLFTVVVAKVSDEELHSFPQLFHLDDFKRCLAKKDGLFCLGTFELTATQPNAILDLMKQHTNERYSFNRTLLRRGYCLSERCQNIPEANATLRFERCVVKHIQRYSLTAHIKTLHYCTTFQQRQEESTREMNREQTWFLYAIGAVLMFNLVGTVYHWYKGDDNLNPFLLAWSIPWNWARFTKVERGGMFTALAPLQSVRMFLQWIVIVAHVTVAHYKVYTQNVEDLEEFPAGFVGVLIGNGTAIVQVFILISCFLTGFNLLYSARRTKITAKILLIWFLKRLTRTLPVYLFVLWFVIAWWPHIGDGPLWPTIVNQDSDACRRKFWTQIFFVNNLVRPLDLCMLQTWAIAVDMQVYILSTAITLLLMKLRVRAVPIFVFLFVASGMLNVTLAYVNGWEPTVRMVRPETVRNVFRYIPSFAWVHYSPWGSMPACFLGLFMAHCYFEFSEKAIGKNKAQIGSGNGIRRDERTENTLDKSSASIGVFDERGKSQIRPPIINVHDTQKNKLNKNNDLDVIAKSSNATIENKFDNGPIRNELDSNELTQINNGIRKRKEAVTSLNEYENCGLHVKLNGSGGKIKKDSQSGENKTSKDDDNETEEVFQKEVANGEIKEGKSGTTHGKDSLIQNLLLRNGHIFVIPTLFLWILAAAPIIEVESAAITALYVGVERAVFTLLFALLLTHLFTVDSGLRRFGAWHGWQAVGRLAYSVLLIHWCVISSIVAARSHVISTSFVYMVVDALPAIIFTYILALPVHLMLELPAQKFLDLLVSVPGTMTQYRQ